MLKSRRWNKNILLLYLDSVMSLVLNMCQYRVNLCPKQNCSFAKKVKKKMSGI